MAEQRAQRRLAAILAADVVGYSRLVGEDEAGTLAMLKSRRKEVLAPLVAKHHGRVFKITGDGVLVEFASAVNAVQCALELQHGMAAANAGQPAARHIVLRVGVNLGDVMVEGSDLYGDGVNIAARLEAIAEPGSILLSATTFDHVKGKLKIAFDDLGPQSLKNIAEPVRAYRVAGTPSSAPPVSKPASDKPSIAVLPFTNMSGDPEQAYFSDGITEDIITELSRFRSLFVIARNSSFQFRDKAVDMKRVGRELGVQYLVEGSVRRASSRMRVTAQLIDARTGNHLWADRFDRDFADIFAVQDEVTRRIVTCVEPVLAAESLRMAKRKPPEDMQAYDRVLKAKELLDNVRNSQELQEARALCDHAIGIDSTFARAHAFRSMSFSFGVMMIEADDLNEWRRQALLSAEQAVSLDVMDAANHFALAWARFLLVQRDQTLTHCAKAISLNPNDADILADAAFFHACYRQHEQALECLEAARERNPTHLLYYGWASGCMFYLLGQYGDAMASFEAYGHPNENVHLWRAAGQIKLGRGQEAQVDMQAVLTLKPKFNVGMARDIFRYLPDPDDFVDALRQAGLPD
jgi:TolB-like protein